MEKDVEKGDELLLDGDGFLQDVAGWDREKAEELAVLNDIGELREEHWKIIDYVREYFLETGQGPPVVKIVKATGIPMNQICTLFPCGVSRGCYRLAGLPRPSGCL
jgi:TusE/DsrC/DsvC family sulfur relay protein